MNRRRAASLVELLFAMSACAVILTMSTALIHRVLHVQSKSRLFFDSERAALRLAEHFRRDVHAAKGAVDADLGEDVFLRLQLATGEEVVDYRRSGSTVLRIVRRGIETRAREEFSFSADIGVDVGQEPTNLVTLTITSQPGKSSAVDAEPRLIAHSAPVSLHIQAQLNRTPGVNASPQEEQDSP